jgi:hypothetical protein
MLIVKIMKRRDASSVLVAIVIAFVIVQLLSIVTSDLSSRLAGLGQEDTLGQTTIGGGGDWRLTYAFPLISFVLQLVLVEALLRLAIWARPYFVRRGR